MLVTSLGVGLTGVLSAMALETWADDVQPSILLSVTGGIALLVVFLLMPHIAKWTIRYENVGHNAP